MGKKIKKIKKVLKLMLFKKSQMNIIAKQTKIWVKKANEFYKRSMKSLLNKNVIEMYSLHKKGKSVVAERFIRTLKLKYTNTWLKYQKMCILIN